MATCKNYFGVIKTLNSAETRMKIECERTKRTGMRYQTAPPSHVMHLSDDRAPFRSPPEYKGSRQLSRTNLILMLLCPKAAHIMLPKYDLRIYKQPHCATYGITRAVWINGAANRKYRLYCSSLDNEHFLFLFQATKLHLQFYRFISWVP